MSYISAIYDRDHNEVFVWERTPEGRVKRSFPAPWYFYVPHPDGEFVSLYGESLIRLDFDNAKAMYKAKQQYKDDGYPVFESDIPPTLKVLSEHYYEAESPDLHVTFFDIEVDYDKDRGFSSPRSDKQAYAPINSVAFYHQWKKEYVVLVVPPTIDVAKSKLGLDEWSVESLTKAINDREPLSTESKFSLSICKNERELLQLFLEEIEDADILSGWNSDFFDIPYVGRRLYKQFGKQGLRQLNFDNRDFDRFGMTPEDMDVKLPYRGVMTKYGTEAVTLDLAGRVRLDYMELFRKFEMAERPSYKLEAIADEVVPDLPKLEYEGTLYDLYRNDFPNFVRYNIRDTEVLHGFEDALGYIALANDMVHLSTGLFQHVQGTIKLAELAIINHSHYKQNVIVPDTKRVQRDESGKAPKVKIQGAFVLLPQVGLHEWVGSVDINSLYPSAIRALNISPETIRGQFEEKGAAIKALAEEPEMNLTLVMEDGQKFTNPAGVWKNLLKRAKWAVSGYGTVFDQNIAGVIPKVLEDWYSTRKHYQQLMEEALEVGDKAKAAYYNRLQYVYKIKLNSCYGALTNQHFKFYDLRMGESTTGTGRMILLHQCAESSKILDGTYLMPDRTETEFVKKTGITKTHVGYTKASSVVYGDTDSTYFSTHAKNEREAVMIADEVGRLVNDSFPEFMRETFLCGDGFCDVIKTGREIVSDKGIFVDKKRYILHIIDNEGRSVDKLKVMGLDTKKTTLPKQVSVKLNSFIERFLKGESWDDITVDIVEYKKQLKESSVMEIGLPKGCTKVEEYLQELTDVGKSVRLPGHIAAAIYYNKCLDENDDKVSMRISSGMKIKVYYLKGKHMRTFGIANRKFKSIALPTDIENVPEWFVDEYKSQIDIDAQVQRLVDNPLDNILKAIEKEAPTEQQLYVSDTLEF